MLSSPKNNATENFLWASLPWLQNKSAFHIKQIYSSTSYEFFRLIHVKEADS